MITEGLFAIASFARRNLRAFLPHRRLALALPAAPLALLTVALAAGRGVAAAEDFDTSLRGGGEVAASTLQQYRSGGHVLGFESRGYYVSNGHLRHAGGVRRRGIQRAGG